MDSAAPWTLLAERPAYQGFVTVTRRTYRMPDGSSADWDVTVAARRTVAVLARTSDDRFVTVRQFRPGPGVLLDELPGGNVDPGEAVEDAAARELLEETGFVPDRVTVVGRAWMAARDQVEQFVTVATGCAPTGRRSPDPFEFAEVRLKTLGELVEQVRTGDLTDAGLAYRALDHLGVLTAPGDG